MTHDPVQTDSFHPKPFYDGHALTFTVREIYDPSGEFLSQYRARNAAAYAFALAQKHASYAELRGTDGQVLADYVRGQGAVVHAAPRYRRLISP